MDRARSRRHVFLVGFAGPLLVLSACGQSEISESDLEASIATQLAEEVDQPEPNIDCPGPLEAEVGATTECELSVEGDDAVYPVSVEITSIDGDQARYDVQVGESPISGGEPIDEEGDVPVEDGEDLPPVEEPPVPGQPYR